LRWPVVAVSGLILALTLTACGAQKTGDASNPLAQQCKAVLEARLNVAFPSVDAAPDQNAANLAIANALAGPQPKECTNVSDTLGAKLMNQIVAAADGRYQADAGALAALPTPGAAAPTEGPGAAPTDTPSASVTDQPSPAPTAEATATPTTSPTDAPD
jgi:hypothetical protein